MRLRKLASGRWVILWSPSIVQPRLTAKTRLGTDRIDPELVRRSSTATASRSSSCGRSCEVGLVREPRQQRRRRARRRSRGCVGVDAAVATSARRAAPGPCSSWRPMTLRARGLREGWRSKSEGDPREPARTTRRCRSRPSLAFARAAARHGRPGHGRADQALARARCRSATTSASGASRPQFNRHLAGTQDVSIIVRSRDTGDALRTLEVAPGQARRAASYDALDRDVQAAAETALGSSTAPVGDRRGAAVDGRHPRGRQPPDRRRRSTARSAGAYAPGSTFKVITDDGAAARTGSTRATTVAVPDARSPSTAGCSSNFEGGSGGVVDLRRATSRSRATRRSSRSPRGSAPTPCRRPRCEFGRRPERAPALRDARARTCPPGARRRQPRGDDDRPGPDRRDARSRWPASRRRSPNGRWRAAAAARRPIRTSPGPPLAGAQELATAAHAHAQGGHVSGTGTALASTPGEVRPARRGTAEFGGGDPPPTHAWFICLPRRPRDRGARRAADAPAASVAAPIAARFFAAYDAAK